MSLRERVLGYVEDHPRSLLVEIARGVRARTADVRDVLLSEPDVFSGAQRLAYESDRALVYTLAPNARDGRGRVRKPSQCDLILSVLRDGQWHTAAEIHDRCGYSRLNSRISELRDRGHNIPPCEHIDGAGTGPEAYRYRLIETPEEAASEGARRSLPGDGSPAASSGVSTVTNPCEGDSGQPSEHLQLALGEAA